MWDALVDIMGDAAVAEVKAKPAADCLEAILGSHDWNGSRTAVQEVVGKYLARLLVGRNTMLGLDVKATDGDKQMAPPVGPGHDMPTNAASQVPVASSWRSCLQMTSLVLLSRWRPCSLA
jgi:hypothetical protein